MITEYVDCTELKRLIEDKKLKPAALKYYLRRKGIIFTASNAKEFAEQVYTVFLGAGEMSAVRDMLTNDGNYEKSLVMNLSIKSDYRATNQNRKWCLCTVFIYEKTSWKK